MITFNLPKGWKASQDKYDIENDQKMRNIQNFITPRGKVLSLFVIDAPAEEGIKMIDTMIRDYKNITKHLYLMLFARLKIREILFPIYIVGEKRGGSVMAQVLFQMKGLAFSLLFPIEKYVPRMTELMAKNDIFKDVIAFFREQK